MGTKSVRFRIGATAEPDNRCAAFTPLKRQHCPTSRKKIARRFLRSIIGLTGESFLRNEMFGEGGALRNEQLKFKDLKIVRIRGEQFGYAFGSEYSCKLSVENALAP